MFAIFLFVFALGLIFIGIGLAVASETEQNRSAYLAEIVPANIAISQARCKHKKWYKCVGGKFCAECGEFDKK